MHSDLEYILNEQKLWKSFLKHAFYHNESIYKYAICKN